MDEHSVHKPLLQNGDADTVHDKNSPLYVSSIRWFLKVVMWVSFVAWIALMFLYPSEFGSQLVRKLEQGTSGTVFGITGWEIQAKFSCFIVYLLIAVLLVFSSLILEIFRKLFLAIQWTCCYYCIFLRSASYFIWRRGTPEVCNSSYLQLFASVYVL